MNCSICGTANSDGADFCRHCGVSIAHAATTPPAARAGRCPRCGGDCALPARFCDRCGIRMAPQPGAAGREAARAQGVAAPPRERMADAMFGAPAMGSIATPPAVVAAPDDAARTEAVEEDMAQNQATEDEPRPGRKPGARRRAALAAGAIAALAGVCVSGYWLADALLFGRSPWPSPALSPPAMQSAAARPAAPAGTEPAPPAAIPPIAAASPMPQASTPQASMPQSSMPFSLPSEAALPLAGSPDEKRAPPPAASHAPAKPGPAPAPRVATRKAADAPASSGDGTSSNATASAGARETALARRDADTADGQRAAPRPITNLASVSWQTALRAQLAECGRDPSLFGRIVCRERAKFRYCGPNHWGKAEECVQTRRRDSFAADASG